MDHPFADLIGLTLEQQGEGSSTLLLPVDGRHLNPHGVVHGAVIYAMADTGMGAALYSTLDAGYACATIDISITYFRPVIEGQLLCQTVLDNKGRTVAHLTARITQNDKLIAQASGNFAIMATPPERR
ncbi:PaaI family thioesterase [Sphingorhabdus sp. EL138]|uniref:PaaI family thioesterase n=1 Tax=Sphingorhabdus sp. EL138 TaxID=2073156 RepID=UPI0025D0CB2A|nr:PaaI family thioesterase [Sphingorhabdus sp. EL138]